MRGFCKMFLFPFSEFDFRQCPEECLSAYMYTEHLLPMYVQQTTVRKFVGLS